MGGGIDGALIKLAAQLLEAFNTGIFWIVSYFMGVCLAVRSAWKLKLHSDNPSHHPLSSAVVSFLICSALIALPNAMDTIRQSIGFASIAESPLGYASSGVGGGAIEKAIYIYAAFFGYIAFLRGLMILNKGAEPSKRGDELGRGITHLVGAVMATNLSEVVAGLKWMFL